MYIIYVIFKFHSLWILHKKKRQKPRIPPLQSPPASPHCVSHETWNRYMRGHRPRFGWYGNKKSLDGVVLLSFLLQIHDNLLTSGDCFFLDIELISAWVSDFSVMGLYGLHFVQVFLPAKPCRRLWPDRDFCQPKWRSWRWWELRGAEYSSQLPSGKVNQWIPDWWVLYKRHITFLFFFQIVPSQPMDNRSQTNNEFEGFLYKQRGHFAAEAAHGCKGMKENQFLERNRLSRVLTMFEIDILSILYIHRSSEIPIPPKSPNFPFLLEHAIIAWPKSPWTLFGIYFYRGFITWEAQLEFHTKQTSNQCSKPCPRKWLVPDFPHGGYRLSKIHVPNVYPLKMGYEGNIQGTTEYPSHNNHASRK